MRIAVAGATGTAGRYVVDAVRQAGHVPVALSRSGGVDLRDDAPVRAALQGVEVVIDVSNYPGTDEEKATEYFTDVTKRLHRQGAVEGVSRLVTLSIVGIDRSSSYGYYRAKLAQERAVVDGPLPATIVRATQFHEFAGQILSRRRFGPIALMPMMRVQPIAARSVAEVLVQAAVAEVPETMVEVAGPQEEKLVAMARSLVRYRGARIMVVPLPLPGPMGKESRGGSLLPRPRARIVGPTFARWLGSEDARQAPL